ncbi:MAG: riboflavin synthase [Actinomycetales bacterium mxb001]|nr:MAG: riboflavin synthase [Actinomycetales bacterium mxb001]
MFTGIVEELGEVVDVVDLPDDARRVTIVAPIVLTDASLGDSIAVNGVCLTVAELGDRTFTADVMRETLQRSSLRDVAPGARVNLERPVTLATRLGGHLVQGHVDGTGTLLSRQPSDHWDVVCISLPDDLARYVVEKGSITVDGVSLTVAGVGHDERGHWFSVSLIPTTLEVTNLGRREVGDVVNLEVDVIAKYVERLSEFGARS